jgi:hypothetical protein
MPFELLLERTFRAISSGFWLWLIDRVDLGLTCVFIIENYWMTSTWLMRVLIAGEEQKRDAMGHDQLEARNPGGTRVIDGGSLHGPRK